MSKSEENNCPICITIPLGKIFQCKEGHIVCESCLLKIQDNASESCRRPTCPFCARPLDHDAVSRNRVMENLLDNLIISCPHAKHGCSIKIKRSEVQKHAISCLYGKTLDICRRLQIDDGSCKFQLSTGKAKDFVRHLKNFHWYHSVIFSSNPVICTMNLSNHSKKFLNPTFWRSELKDGIRFYMMPLPGDDDEKHVAIIIQVSKDSVSFSAIDLSLALSEADNLRVTFSIPNNTTPEFTWSFPVACGIKSWDFLNNDNESKPIEISPQSLFRYCNVYGNVDVMVEVTSAIKPSKTNYIRKVLLILFTIAVILCLISSLWEIENAFVSYGKSIAACSVGFVS